MREDNRSTSEYLKDKAMGCLGCLGALIVGSLLLLVGLAVLIWSWGVVFGE